MTSLRIALCSSLLLAVALPAQETVKRPAKPRVAVLGASVSNGFGCGIVLAAKARGMTALEGSEKFLGISLSKEEFLRRTQGVGFRTLLGPVFKDAGVRLLDYSDTQFFLSPRTHGRNQVEKAIKREAQLVLGVDFLFWFVYGSRWLSWDPNGGKTRAEAMREQEAAKLQFGLDLIEKRLLTSGVTVVIGTIPDMRGCDPRVLPAGAVAPVETVKWANERIRAFAKKHERVLLYPLFERAAAMRSGSFAIGKGEVARYGNVAGLLQVDLLHTTRLGSAVLAYDVLSWLDGALPEDHVCHPGAPKLDFLLSRARATEDYAALPKEPAEKQKGDREKQPAGESGGK